MLWANIRLSLYCMWSVCVYTILRVIRSTSLLLFNVREPVIDSGRQKLMMEHQVFQIRGFIMLLQKRQSGIGC